MARAPDLPSFEHPPVVEVALSVQFEPLPLQAKHLALLWEGCRSDFPEWSDHPPIPPAFELFGPRRLTTRVRGMPPSRALFRNAAGTELKQYQSDRFVRNWTKSASIPEYPRYESIRERFLDDLRSLVGFLDEHALGGFVPNQCEVTYVNLIPLGDGFAAGVGEVVHPWNDSYSDSFLSKPEATEINAHFIMTEPERLNPVGRLHVESSVTSLRNTGKSALQLTLTARGEPIGAGIDGILAFLDLGREHIVRGFASFTTNPMHKSWGRSDGSS